MTVGSIISRLRNSLKEVSRDSTYTNRYLWSTIVSGFLKFINQKNNIHKLDVFTTIDIETEEVNLLESSCVPLNCTGWRIKLDNPLETKNGMIFRYITTPDLSQVFKLVSPKLFKLKSEKKKGNTNYAFLEGDYIYINKCFPCLKVSYLSKDGEPVDCSKLNNKLNIPDYMLDNIIRNSIQEISPFIPKPTDRTSNKTEVA